MTQAIPYTIVRSRRKTLCLTVTDGGKVVVRAPISTPEAEIDAFVVRHRRWIEKRCAARAGEEKPKFRDGEEIGICGVRYTIREGTARFDGHTLYLPREGREEQLILLLKECARRRMTAFVADLCKQYGFRCSSVRITSARTRWGSCNAKGVCFTFRTAFLPDELAYYLAVHELCHTRRMDHSAAFWGEVGKIVADYPARRRALLHAYSWAMRCL